MSRICVPGNKKVECIRLYTRFCYPKNYSFPAQFVISRNSKMEVPNWFVPFDPLGPGSGLVFVQDFHVIPA